MKFWKLVSVATVLVVSTSVNASLLGRDFDGNLATAEAYYDDLTNLTWLADANYAYTSGYVNTITTSYSDGRMTWGQANTWAAGLDFNGINNWRLADSNPIDGTTSDDSNFSYNGSEDRGFNISAPGTLYAGTTANEMAYLYYNTLGNLGFCDPVLSTTTSCSSLSGTWGMNSITGPFSNVQHTGANTNGYWASQEYLPSVSYSSYALYFNFGTGAQTYYGKMNTMYAWAVHSGDVGVEVSTVTVPAAVWLFGSGLIGLIGMARRKKS